MFIFGLLIGLVVGMMVTAGLVLWVTSFISFGQDFHDAYHPAAAGYGVEEHKAYEAEPESPIEKRPSYGRLPPSRVTQRAARPDAYSDAELEAVQAALDQHRIQERQKEQIEGAMQED
jgi:hypothetical protein